MSIIDDPGGRPLRPARETNFLLILSISGSWEKLARGSILQTASATEFFGGLRVRSADQETFVSVIFYHYKIAKMCSCRFCTPSPGVACQGRCSARRTFPMQYSSNKRFRECEAKSTPAFKLKNFLQ